MRKKHCNTERTQKKEIENTKPTPTVRDREMASTAAESSTWEEIELGERYLLCCMFEEAASLASSIIRKLRENRVENGCDDELDDMFEAAGMVLVQSMKELGRTLDILKELRLLFGSVTAIPAQVFHTGVCFQISEGLSSGVQEFLEEFLNNWRYLGQEHYFSAEATVTHKEGIGKQFSLGVDEYLGIVELYVMTYLGMVTREIDVAISWIETAEIPEEKRQEFLRQLHSMNGPKATSSSQGSLSNFASAEEHKLHIKSSQHLEPGLLANGENSVKETILNLSGQRVPCIWWFRTFTLKFGNYRLVLSNGNVLLGCLFLFICYFCRRKQATLKRFVRKQVLSIKKALVDVWQLAFSYQVNPLAAVQPLPAVTHGSR